MPTVAAVKKTGHWQSENSSTARTLTLGTLNDSLKKPIDGPGSIAIQSFVRCRGPRAVVVTRARLAKGLHKDIQIHRLRDVAERQTQRALRELQTLRV